MKRSKDIILLVAVIVSVCLSIFTTAFSLSLNAKLSKIEAVLIEATGKGTAQKTPSVSDKDKKLEYTTGMFGDAEVKYPQSGTVGKKNDKNNRYIEIESFNLRVGEYDVSNGYLHFDFIGTDYYSSYPTITAKQYDKDGLCISEAKGHMEIVQGEKSKGICSIGIDRRASSIIVDIEP